MTFFQLVLLFFAGLAGGFVDAIAGGGGLITVPALLSCGLSPQVTLGTNKFQSCIGTLIAVRRYAHAGLISTPWLWLAAVFSFVGGIGGAFAVTVLSKELL